VGRAAQSRAGVRFWQNDILANTDGVLKAILHILRGG
jgi:very-short-patch-repair endonuclease